MKGSTIFLVFLLAMLTQGSALGADVVQVALILRDGKTTYRARRANHPRLVLVVALIHAKAWQIKEAEANRLKQSCATDECRDRTAR